MPRRSRSRSPDARARPALGPALHPRLPREAWLIFLDDLLAGVYRVETPTGCDPGRCREPQERYADLALGVVDASVLARAERLVEPKVATLDHRHFRAVRPAMWGHSNSGLSEPVMPELVIERPPVRVYTPVQLNGRSVTWVTPTFSFERPFDHDQEHFGGHRESRLRRCPPPTER